MRTLLLTCTYAYIYLLNDAWTNNHEHESPRLQGVADVITP